MAAGSEDTDAVNVAQLKAATVDLDNIQGIARTRSGNETDGYINTTTIEDKLSVSSNGAFSISGDKFTVDSNGAISAAGGKFTVGADGTLSAFGGKFTVDSNGINVGNMKITGLADGSADTDAVNVAQLKAATFNMQGIKRTETGTPGETGYVATTTIEDKLSVSSNGAFSISGDKFTVDSDGAISAANGKFSVNSSGVLTVGSATQNTSVSDTGLTIKDGPSVTTTGIDAGGNKITGVGMAVNDTDAVNFSQLKTAVLSMSVTGGEFITGQGLTAETISENDKSVVVFKVKAGEGLGFDSYGALKVNAGDGLTIDTENGNVLKVNKGTIADNDEGEGFVTGKTVYEVTSPLQEKTQNITFTPPDPENATDSGTTTVSGKLIVGDGTDNVTMTGGAITTTSAVTAGTGANQVVIGSDGVKVGGATLDASGLAIGTAASLGASGLTVGNTNVTSTGLSFTGSETSITSGGINAGGNKITGVATGEAGTDAVNKAQMDTAISGVTYNAGNGIVMDTQNKTISVNPGDGLTIGTDGKLNVNKSDVVSETATGLVTGKTVFNALSAYAKSDGATLTNATISSGNITKGVGLVWKDSSTITVGDLVTTVDALNDTVNNTDSGLVKKVADNTGYISDLQVVVGSETSGLVKDVITLQAKTQNITLSEGTTTISGALSAGATTVSGLTVGDRNVTTALTTPGAVAENNAGFVTGGVVYSALQAYQPDGVIEKGNTKAVSGGTVYNVTSGLDARITENKEVITTTGITFTGDTGTSGAVKLGDTLAVKGDSNITTEATDGNVAIKLNNSINLGNEGSITIGNATLNTSGLAIGTAASLGASGLTVGNTSVSDTGLTIKDGPSVTSDGIAAGGKKITGVATGEDGTDAVNKAQMDTELAKVSAGAVYSGGDGVAISEDRKISVKKGNGLSFADDGTLTVDNGDGLTFDGNKLKVNAGAGLTFDSGALKVNAGDGLTIGTDGKLNVNKSGEVSETDTGLVTGKTVFNALSAYAKSDGATLTNATISTGSSIRDEVKLGTGDTAVSVGSLKKNVATNTSDISSLQTTVDGHTTAIGTINTSITGINDSITSLSTGKANVNLDNISDKGKAAVRSLISVAQGNNVTVTKSTSDTGVDTYTISAADGVTYSAGDGISISDTNAISVTANGKVEENNTGIVTGGTVYSAIEAAKTDVNSTTDTKIAKAKTDIGTETDMKIATAKADIGTETDTKIATAKTDITSDMETKLGLKANASDVYTKAETYSQAEVDATLADYVKADGATLTNATLTGASLSNAAISSGSIADDVMLGDSISVGGLKSDVSGNKAAINSLKSTVGDATGGLVKDVSTLQATVGDTTGGLVKDVKDNKDSINALATTVGDENSGLVQKVNSSASSITALQDKTKNITVTEDATTIAGKLSAGATTVTSLTDGTATLSGGALTGVTTITASGAIGGGSLNVGMGAISGGTLSVGGMATVTGLTVGETNVTTALTTEGAVAANNAGFVSGGAVYSALQAFKPDGKVEEGDTKAVSGGTVYKVTSGLDARIKTNADAIATKADASTVTELSGKVTANEEAIKTNADAIATKADASTVTELSGKVTANEAAIKTNADAIATKADASTVTELSGKVTANEAAIKTNADNITTLTGKVTANETAIKTNATNIAANTKNITANTEAIASNKKAIEANTKNITANTDAIASNKKAIEKNTSDITSLSTKVTANETAIKTNADNIATNTKNISANTEAISSNKSAIEKNAGDITALGKKVTANETTLAQKADKANTLQGYGIEDAYTKEDSDTLLNKKADKTEFEAVKVVVGDTNSGLVKDVNDLKNSILVTEDESGAKTTVIDGNLVIKEEDGTTKDVTAALTTDGEIKDNNHGYVEGDKVYEYLNKGENGEVKLAAESKQIAMGQGSEASGSESISIGNEVGGQKNEASGTQSIAVGFGNKVTGSHSGAIGDPNIVATDNSYAVGNNNIIGGKAYADGGAITENNIYVFGNNNNISGSNTFVLGSNVNTSATNAVVLGDGSVGVDNAVSVGAPGNERQIKNVAPGTEATDAATVGQVQEVAQGAYNNAVYLSNSINKLDNRVNKVGAGAAALAALHPIDTDDKFTMGLGYGNYRSAHAMAMGMFYRPTEKIMISVGGAFGNGENMVNAGISFALDKGKGFGTSKAVMAKNIKALSAENAAIKEENAGMKKQLDAQGQEIAALKAALARLEAKIGK